MLASVLGILTLTLGLTPAEAQSSGSAARTTPPNAAALVESCLPVLTAAIASAAAAMLKYHETDPSASLPPAASFEYARAFAVALSGAGCNAPVPATTVCRSALLEGVGRLRSAVIKNGNRALSGGVREK